MDRRQSFILFCVCAMFLFVLHSLCYASDELPKKRKFDHPKFSEKVGSKYRLTRKYDRFEDVTTLKVFITLEDYRMYLGAVTSFVGREVSTPEIILLYFMSISDDWEYLYGQDLKFLIDGKLLDIGEMELDARVGNGNVSETMLKHIGLQTFLKIINAKKVEGKLFTTEFELSHEQLEALRDFASRLRPSEPDRLAREE